MTDDDYDYDPREPAFPVSVRLAGAGWVAVGILSLLSAALQIMMAGAANNVNANNAAPAAPGQSPISGCCPALFGIAFIYVGIQTVTGKAKDTLGNAIGSLIFGGLIATVCVLVLVLMNANPNAAAGMRFGGIEIAIMLAMSLLYIVPGILALVGRRSYRAWKKYHAPVRRRRRRDDDFEDDSDDEPRPRRRRRDDEDDE